MRVTFTFAASLIDKQLNFWDFEVLLVEKGIIGAHSVKNYN